MTKTKAMFVYILECSDGSYYAGVTNNVSQRVHEHNKGFDKNCYTYERRPVVLAFQREFDGPLAAIAFEKQVKGWSRAKKKALIDGDIKKLRELSKSKNPSAGSG